MNIEPSVAHTKFIICLVLQINLKLISRHLEKVDMSEINVIH